MPQFIGIDIGNSGVRGAVLDVQRQLLGNLQRVNWLPSTAQDTTSQNNPAHSNPTDNRPARYRPDDAAWFSCLRQQLNLPHGPRAAPQHWLISSVRRDALQVLHQALQASSQHTVTVVEYAQLPLRINVAYPERVGIDRLLAALAATELARAGPAIVIQAGSAVTVDLVQVHASEQLATEPLCLGTFEGGAIIPGVPMMLRLLGTGADLLPEMDAEELLDMPSLPGKNTEAAMTRGAASALVGGVIHLVADYRSQLGKQVPVILSGGDGMRLAPYLSAPLISRAHLVHRGLLRLAQLWPAA